MGKGRGGVVAPAASSPGGLLCWPWSWQTGGVGGYGITGRRVSLGAKLRGRMGQINRLMAGTVK
jgi:hypothetical protein